MSPQPKLPTLLFLSPCLPSLRGTGWQQRAFQFLKGYAQVAQIELVCLGFDLLQQSPEELAQLQQICRSVDFVDMKQVLLAGGFVLQLKRALTPWPLLATVRFEPEFQAGLQQRIANADFIHAFRLEPFAIVPPTAWAKTLLDLDECHVTTQRRRRQQQQPGSKRAQLKAWASALDSVRLATYQKAIVKRVALAFVCSGVERQRIDLLAPITVVPNVASSISQPPRAAPLARPQLLFVGNLSNPANVDAVLFFARQIWPLVVAHCPECCFVVAGRTPTAEILALGQDQQIQIWANVPDLGGLYQTSTAALVPLRFGAGTKLKLLEAFGYGTPVVSTSVGCEGIPVENGQHFLLADAPDVFANACLRLLRQPQLRHQIATAAWNYIQEHHNAIAVQNKVAKVFSQVAQPVQLGSRALSAPL
jgi:polysaccharide biosynthesis protein PslH